MQCFLVKGIPFSSLNFLKFLLICSGYEKTHALLSKLSWLTFLPTDRSWKLKQLCMKRWQKERLKVLFPWLIYCYFCFQSLLWTLVTITNFQASQLSRSTNHIYNNNNNNNNIIIIIIILVINLVPFMRFIWLKLLS